MKPMIRRVSLLLCLTMLLGMMLAAGGCGKSEDNGAQTTTAANADAAGRICSMLEDQKNMASENFKNILP